MLPIEVQTPPSRRHVDDDDVGQFRFAAHERFQTSWHASRTRKFEAGENTLADLPYDVGIIGNHQALHSKLPLSRVRREFNPYQQPYAALAKISYRGN